MKLRTISQLAIVFLLIATGFIVGPASRGQSAVPKIQGLPGDPPVSTVEYIPSQLLVQFKASASSLRTAAILSEQGVVRIKRVPALRVSVLQLPASLPVERAVDIFNKMPEVEYAEPNYVISIAQTAEAWQDNQWAPQKIQAPEAWALIPNPATVTIAVVDTGIDYRHSQLAPNMWQNSAEASGQPGVDDDSNGYIDDIYGWDFVNSDSDPMGDHPHGTHVAGIAAATVSQDPSGMAGVCPFCRLMAVKVLDANGAGALDVVANGITYAANNGAKVINLSLGATMGATTLQNAVDYAWSHGAVVVAAAGNNGTNTLFYPAAYTNAIAVASTNVNDYHSCFSNYGNATNNFISVSAPGEAIYSTTPVDTSGNDTYAIYSGTSMATPHVSGLAGLLFAQDGGRTNATVRELIQATTVDLGSLGTDPYFGTGRINAYRAAMDIRDATIPPEEMFSDNQTASGYAHARKLARDASGTLHLIWHTKDGSTYRVRYATSTDNGVSWTLQPDVFSSTLETYHPALAIDDTNLYVAFPSKTASTPTYYQILFSRKPLVGGSWSAPVPLMGGTFNAVRPDLYRDPTNGRLHLVASSLDDTTYVYYRSSSNGGDSWGPVVQVNPTTPTTASKTRYATVHANGNNIYIAARTVNASLFTTYYLHTVRSIDGGTSWIDQFKVSSYLALLTGEYGVSLAGVGDRLYMAYEVGGNLYFRRYDGTGWSDYLQLESSGKWPSITQSEDGQAWMIWEVDGSLMMRHYTGTVWEPAQTLFTANSFDKRYYPNLKLGSSGGMVEWASTSCCGAPFRLVYTGMATGPGPTPTDTPLPTPTYTATSLPTDTPTPTPTYTYTPTETPLPTSTSTSTPTFTYTPTATDTPTPTPLPPSPTSTPITPSPTSTPPPDSGLRSPSANSPGSGGDRNGYEVNPGNAYSDDGIYAVDLNSGTNTNNNCTNTGKDSHTYYNYNFSIPPGTSVRGIEVRLDAKVESTSNSPRICVQLSWNGGVTWTTPKSTVNLSTVELTYFLGNSNDLWGRTWSANDFTNANFRLRVIDVARSTARDFSLDWIAVRLYFQ